MKHKKQRQPEQEPSQYCKTCLTLIEKDKLTPEEFALFKGCRCERR